MKKQINSKAILSVGAVIVFITLFSITNNINKNNGDEKSYIQHEREVFKMTEDREVEELRLYLSENWDKVTIDGSTSMKPLHQALQDQFGKEEKEIEHNRTVDAFNMFLSGENDILLGVSYSDELLKKAEDAGVELASEEITREAFVFLVNEENPIEELTIEELKGIYSGEIKNWKEVGGRDEEIIAYQRNEDSGSQIRMKKFMGDVKLGNKIYEADEMGMLVMYVQGFDGGVGSIGYNMYTFVDKHYEGQGVRFINVNGIEPTDETIFNEEYPIVIYNYLYWDKKNELATEFSDKLYRYLMTEDGQLLLGDIGYVNIKNKVDKENQENKEVLDDDNYDYYYSEYKSMYNLEKREFYSLDEYGRVTIHNSYADWVLSKKYIKNENARKFLTILEKAKIISPNLQIDETENTIALRQLDDKYSLYAQEIYNFFYEGWYYQGLTYYIDEDKYVLTGAGLEWIGHSQKEEYNGDFPLDRVSTVDIEISENDLENISMRLLEYDYKQKFEDIKFYQPFK